MDTTIKRKLSIDWKQPLTVQEKRALRIMIPCMALFAYSALDKAVNYESFRTQMGKSPLLTGWEDILMWVVPLVELFIAGLLAAPRTRLIGYYSFFTLMVTFTGYIVLLLNEADDIPCGCNALLESLSLEWHVVINIVFIVLSVKGLMNMQTIKNKPSC